MRQNKKLTRTQIYLVESDYDFIKETAIANGITISEQIRRIMYEWITRNKE
jgi:hypothetical protein